MCPPYLYVLSLTIYDGCVADGSITCMSKRDDSLFCREDDNSLLCGKLLNKRSRVSVPDLPKVCYAYQDALYSLGNLVLFLGF